MKHDEYATWGSEQEKARMFEELGQALNKVQPIVRHQGAHASNIYLNIAPQNTSVRDSFTRSDYEDFRQEERLPRRPKDVMRACMMAADNNGLVSNVFSLMSDFAVQGIGLVHPNERVEGLYREWARRTHMVERSERFANILIRCGTVVVRRQTARLTPTKEEEFRKSIASPDATIDAPVPLEDREIPWRYTFLNPLSVEVMAENLATFIGEDGFVYAVKVPDDVSRVVQQPRTEAERRLVAKLPPDIRKLLAAGEKLIPLDQDKISVHHYKRDDWKVWGTPMLAPVLKDLSMLEKMKLADLAALDGAISSIRVWKLGSIDAKIMPSESIILRLAEMLNNNVGGGVMDLVWGPDIELLETKTDVHNFLGETKYAPVLASIFNGLGVPPSLTGSPTPGGFTNNYISLKTLTERLEYVRSILRDFWEQEIRLFQRALGLRFPAQLVFDKLLTDETAEKQLLLHMADRNIISDETLRAMCDIPDIEEVRLRRQMKKRESGKLPPKSGPYHNANVREDFEKLFIQTGAYTPEQFGIELDEKTDKKAKSPLEMEAKLAPKPAPGGAAPARKKGTPGQGRPRSSKDSSKRKQKTVKPRTKASSRYMADVAWAQEAQGRIEKLVSGPYLKSVAKKTLRELTDEERAGYESFKFGVLCNLPVGSEVTERAVGEVIRSELGVPGLVAEVLRAAVAVYVEENGTRPSLEVQRWFQSSAYALSAQGEDDDDDDDEEEGGPAGDPVP